MDFRRYARDLVFACGFFAVLATFSNASPLLFRDEFEADVPRQWQAESGEWEINKGVLRRASSGDSLYRASVSPLKDVVVEGRVRISDGGRQTFGIALRLVGQSYLLVRYYDSPRALELLSYQDGQWTQTGSRSPTLSLKADAWYRFKVAAVANRVMAKLWPDKAEEPDWQLEVTVSNQQPGTFALVAHDDTLVEFDWVTASNKAEVLSGLQARVAREEAERRAALAAKLGLAVVPESQHRNSATGGQNRKLHIVPNVENDRYPIAGRLTVNYGDVQTIKDLSVDDFDLGEVRLDLPEVSEPTPVQVTFETDVKTLREELVLQPEQTMSWRDYVRTCLDTLMKHGRDQYGTVSSPLFMAVLDADLLVSPEKPLPLDALVRLEDRLHRRGERGSNLWYDQGLLRALYRMTTVTEDDRYATAADDYIRYFFDHCYKQTAPGQIYLNGMPAWGTHVYWDCYQDRPAGDGDGNGPHEILVYDADWENMYRVHPQGVRRTIEGIWRHHLVDPTTGLFNRHDDAQHGCDFAFSGGSFIKAFAVLYEAANDPQQLHRAKTVANWHWNNRNRETGLTADCPGLPRRYDGNHTFTTVVGPYATALLKAYEFAGDASFRDMAFSYIKSYDRHAWDESQQSYWAMLALNGKPVPEQPKGSGYDAFAPYGHVDVWRTVIYSYEFTLSAAQAAVQAYETSVRDGAPDPELLEIAVRWGRVVEAAMPPDAGRRWKMELEGSMPRLKETSGGYAEDYGRAISLFVHLFRATDDRHYLELAEQLAAEAVDKLYHNGIFLGHPAKPYYESTNGVGVLLYALLELDSPNEKLDGAL